MIKIFLFLALILGAAVIGVAGLVDVTGHLGEGRESINRRCW